MLPSDRPAAAVDLSCTDSTAGSACDDNSHGASALTC